MDDKQRRINAVLNEKATRIRKSQLAGKAVWGIGAGYTGKTSLLIKRIKAYVPESIFIGCDGTIGDYQLILAGQESMADAEVPKIVDGCCDGVVAVDNMSYCFNLPGSPLVVHDRFSATMLTNLSAACGVRELFLVGFIPGFTSKTERKNGLWLNDFWIPPEGLSDLGRLQGAITNANESGTDVYVVSPLNTDNTPWPKLGDVISAAVRRKGKNESK